MAKEVPDCITKFVRVATAGKDLVVVENLRKHFPIQTGFLASLLNHGHIPAVKAVDGVSFTIRRGEVFGLAGESGSGKSTIGRLILRLYEPTSGKVIFDGIDLQSCRRGNAPDAGTDADRIPGPACLS